MIEDSTNRLLMSDSIRGMIPELEEEYVASLSDSCVIITLELQSELSEPFTTLSGILVGISMETVSLIKIDIRTRLNEAYDTIKKYSTSGLSCRMFYMHLEDNQISLSGPYKISSSKILDVDHQNKMCTLGVDLIKF
jgi:hypothetical protein